MGTRYTDVDDRSRNGTAALALAALAGLGASARPWASAGFHLAADPTLLRDLVFPAVLELLRWLLRRRSAVPPGDFRGGAAAPILLSSPSSEATRMEATRMEALLERLRSDRDRGAAELVALAGDAYRAALERVPASAPADELRVVLERAARDTVAAQPAMAPLATLAAELRGALAAKGPDGARAAVVRLLDELPRRLERAPVEIARLALELLPAGARVLTLSNSSTVRSALLAAAARGPLRVVCLESRPRLEGRALADVLAAAGAEATLAPDAAMATLVASCDLVIVGADSVGDGGVVNKIGTHAAALCARAAGVAAYVLADSMKLLPHGAPQPVADERPPDEMWDSVPEGVRVWNRYFEATPLALFTAVVTEVGVLGPPEVELRRAALPAFPGVA